MLITKRVLIALMCGLIIVLASVAAYAVEMKLAGIKLGSPAASVLKMYGNPTRVTVATTMAGFSQPGQTTPGMPGMTGPGGMPGAAVMPGTGGLGPMGAMPSGTGGQAPTMPGMPGFATVPSGSTLPTMPGLVPPGTMGTGGYPGTGGTPTMPGMPGTPGMPGFPGAEQQQQVVLVEQEVTWTYDLQDGTTVEFIISGSGRVIQITVGGDRPFTLSRTSKGIKLGSYYKDVIFNYGYPESHSYVGRFLRASYAEDHRVVFTFYGPGAQEVKKVVGITIALKPEGEE